MEINFESLRSFLSVRLFNNTLQDYLFSSLLLTGLILFFMITRQIVLFRLRKFAAKTPNDFDNLLVSAFSRIGPSVFVITSLYIATLPLELQPNLRSLIHYVFVAILTIRGILIFQEIAGYGIDKGYRRARPDDLAANTVIRNLRTVVSWGLWILGSIFILDNLGINISTVVAGLGIGGIAVAMASQAVLGDAFSAISIFVDKPFQVGDTIKVGDFTGTVEHIGIKTTRLRSILGEQVVFSNSDLTGSRIQNFKRMADRRITFTFGVTYQATSDQIRKIPDIVRNIFSGLDKTKLDRVHFKSFGDSALIFEVAYSVLSPDYNVYMDRQQSINLSLKEIFEREGIEFAYPTQTLYVVQQPGLKLPS